MATPASAAPVKLFIITIHSDTTIRDSAIDAFQVDWGKMDYHSEDFDFDQTNYYEAEMG